MHLDILKSETMDASIGVNLRVTAHSNQGGRKYMEDMFCVAYQPTSDEKDLLYAYFGIFDGHGGREAALYAKTHLMDHIVSQKNFWSEDDELVLRSIKDGFISVHQAMWRELDKWPKTQSGLPSTSGTTASVAFVRRGKLYIGHVGDSGIVLGHQDPSSNFWKARPLTVDHKPESPQENARIQECGGKVVSKSGVPRVVWNRPRIGHKGPVRRSTLIDEIPFLAVARSLGDLWSYNSEQDEFVVSPVPDTAVIEIDVNTHRCLILGSDGLWNMLSAQDAVNSVYFAEKNNERQNQINAQEGTVGPGSSKNWINPSKRLVDRALDRWYSNNLRADNTSVVTVVIDPPGPPRVPKEASPRHSTPSASLSLSPERASPVSRLSCAQTNNHHVSTPSPRFHRTIATTRFANTSHTEKHSPPRILHSPTHYHSPTHHPQPHASTSSSVPPPQQQQPGSKPSGKVTPSGNLGKIKPTTSATNLNRPRQPPQQRDLPTRSKRSHPVLSSKTSRVAHVRNLTSPTTSQNQRASTSSSSTSVKSSDVTSELGKSTDAVQINEISSSCEASWRSSAVSELDDSIQATSVEPTSGTKKQRRSTKRLQPRNATAITRVAAASTSKGRKRGPTRQSAPVEEGSDDGYHTVTPSKVVKLSASEDGRTASTSSSAKRSSEVQRLADQQSQEAVSKLRNRTTKDLLPEKQVKSTVTPTASTTLAVGKKGKKGKRVANQKSPSQPTKPVEGLSTTGITTPIREVAANVTKKSLRATIQPIVPSTWDIEAASSLSSYSVDSQRSSTPPAAESNKSSRTTRQNLSSSISLGNKPLKQRNVGNMEPVAAAGEPSSRIISLRIPPSRVSSLAALSSIISSNKVKSNKVTLKRLQQGKKMINSASQKKEFPTNSKKEAVPSSDKKAKDKASNNSAKDKNDEGTKKGRSLRSGDVTPGRLTRSRDTGSKK